jgi:hypothetical protein
MCYSSYLTGDDVSTVAKEITNISVVSKATLGVVVACPHAILFPGGWYYWGMRWK